MKKGSIAAMDVPLLLQNKDEYSCGIVCSQMLFNYFGVAVTYKTLLREVPHDVRQMGMLGHDVGRLFLRRNFSSSIRYHDAKSMSRTFVEKSRKRSQHKTHKKLIRRTYRSCRSNKLFQGPYVRDVMREYCDLGGILTPQPITPAEIRAALQNNVGVILSVVHHYLVGAKKDDDGYHAIVPFKMDDTTIWVNDPYAGVAKYPIEYLMLACYRADAMGILVHPRKSV